MGNLNQLEYVRKYRSIMSGPVLEIGSKDYGNTPNYRLQFPDTEYLGIDMEDGDGVDLVIDMAMDFENLNLLLEGRRFNTIICFSVMEHCKELFKVAENIEKLLMPGGKMINKDGSCGQCGHKKMLSIKIGANTYYKCAKCLNPFAVQTEDKYHFPENYEIERDN